MKLTKLNEKCTDVSKMHLTHMERLLTYFHIKHPDKVRSLKVVFHQTGHPTALLHPGRVSVDSIDLHHCWRQALQTQKTKLKQIWKLNSILHLLMKVTLTYCENRHPGMIFRKIFNKITFKKSWCISKNKHW